MRIGEVKAVLELHRCSNGRATPEQIHKLILLSDRVRRLVSYGMDELSARQQRAYQRAMAEAIQIGKAIGVTKVMRHTGIVLVWMHCSPTEL